MNQKNIYDFYTYLESQETSQEYLYQCYLQHHIPQAQTLSYQNTNRFMYNLEHGNVFYTGGATSHPVMQPILYFYGMTHLLKALLIAIRPHYPESTKLLAHGVSTRKRKKKQYSFLNDEVKIQHQGLFRYFSEHLFHIKTFSFEKISMRQLASLIPELNFLFHLQKASGLIKVGKMDSRFLTFPVDILDAYYLSAQTFITRIKAHTPPIIETEIGEQWLTLTLQYPISESFGPFFIDYDEKDIYFPQYRDGFIILSEVMVHYLLLYNLSMLSRYESQWWGELLTLKPDNEYPIISRFLTITRTKIPLLLGEMLWHNMKR